MNTSWILSAHIALGIAAFLAGIVAAGVKVADRGGHSIHLLAGRIFVAAMSGVFVSAVVLSAIDGNVFMLLVALFSYYLALGGWQSARNRSRKAGVGEWLVSGTMLAAGVAMVVGTLAGWVDAGGNATTLVAFGIIGAALAGRDLRGYRAGGVVGSARISRHLTLMLGAVISTVTAAVVVNVEMSPAFVPWLAPLVVVLPIIVIMNRRVLK